MRLIGTFLLVAMTVLTVGCEPTNVGAPTVNNTLPASSYLASSEPDGALPVGEARATSQDGQEVTLFGRIGGSSKPFVEGIAAFTIVDPKVPYCADDEGCPTPWDYCCQTDAVKSNIATVKIVDEAGKAVAKGARDLLKVKELSTVVVKGKAKRDEQGNLTIAASQVFVRLGE